MRAASTYDSGPRLDVADLDHFAGVHKVPLGTPVEIDVPAGECGIQGRELLKRGGWPAWDKYFGSRPLGLGKGEIAVPYTPATLSFPDVANLPFCVLL